MYFPEGEYEQLRKLARKRDDKSVAKVVSEIVSDFLNPKVPA